MSNGSVKNARPRWKSCILCGGGLRALAVCSYELLHNITALILLISFLMDHEMMERPKSTLRRRLTCGNFRQSWSST